ncbi:hypothetical protein QBC47DRAFT_454376 [Echria macrotheca]|uniref:Uncharacterized protein n=1 Tax=Echria macrotheca TaxID=438768 RepID=A0AAJ0B614_9PEZI|nr:hypothetical protein QBC47DRAFT_454376 [Echria macrotheca]
MAGFKGFTSSVTPIRAPAAPSNLDPPNWKPWSFHPLYLGLLCVLHILYIAGIQILTNKNAAAADLIARIQQNETVTDPESIFVFSEDNMSAYLAWQYLPVALATILAVLWEPVDLSARRLEPFHQLSRPEGGTADDALCLEYAGMFGFNVPFRALARRQYAVVLSSSIFVLVATVITAMAGGIYGIEWASLSYSADRVDDGPKWATVTVNNGVAVATQVLHGIVVAGGLALGMTLFLRRSGLYRDPRGIGGVASLVSESDYITDNNTGALAVFRQLPSFAHSKVVRYALAGIRFRLQHAQAMQPDGSVRMAYQLTTAVDPGFVVPVSPEDRRLFHDRRDATGFFLTRRAALLAEVVIWLGQAAITGALYQAAKVGGAVVGDTSGGGTSAATKQTIAKVVFTLTLTVGGVMWQSIQRELQIFEPWQQLRRPRRGLYKGLVESDLASEGLVVSFLRGLKSSVVAVWAAFSVFTVYLATIFVPPLLELAYAAGFISTSPFPNKTFGIMSGYSALGLAVAGVGIHLVIFCNMLFVMLSGRTKPFLPRRPTTLASQLLYLCHSDRLLADLRGTSTMSRREVASTLARADRTCQFGWFSWRGTWCIGVEEVAGGQWLPRPYALKKCR